MNTNSYNYMVCDTVYGDITYRTTDLKEAEEEMYQLNPPYGIPLYHLERELIPSTPPPVEVLISDGIWVKKEAK